MNASVHQPHRPNRPSLPKIGAPMQPLDTLLIYEKPDAYFFPCYSDRVFAPFGVPQPSLRYLAYKALYLLRLPFCSLFWGKWKDYVKGAKQIIIFDYGYQRGMEKYIRRINPHCRVFLFFWNKVNKYNKNHLRFTDADAIYSTDPDDCKKYGLHYNHIFYPQEYHIPYAPSPGQNKLFFLGADKGRAPYIASLKQALEEGGIICDIRILSPVRDSAYRRCFQEILVGKGLPYNEYLGQIKSCNILLDINQKGQSALTMRVMEALYLSKKLITNNRRILTYDFYCPENILILPEKGIPSPEELHNFLNTPFRPYPAEILYNYSYGHWLDNFLS